MKIGSLVELTGPATTSVTHVELPKMNTIYTVRGIGKNMYGEPGILLEEIINPPMQFMEGLEEPRWNIEYFRELQPPMELSFVREIQEENKLFAL